MRNLNECILCTILVTVTVCRADLQIDTLAVEDSLSNENKLEEILEQSKEIEDSPLLDFLKSDDTRKQSGVQIRSRWNSRLQSSVGFKNGSYVGSSVKSYQRIKFVQGEHLSGGILLEKDAGEKRFNDFTTANLTLSQISPVTKFVLGDYFVEAGQGITLWRGYVVGKGSDVITPVKRNASGLNSYLSSGENAFLRGLATELRFGNFYQMIFYSHTARGASLDTNGNIANFYTVGYYRTAEELAKRDNVMEKLFGMRSVYQISNRSSVGLTFYTTSFSKQLRHDLEKTFFGGGYSILSIDFSFTFSSVSLFGEVARNSEAISANSGILLTPSDAVSLVAEARHYPNDFTSLHGLSFGEQTSGEDGIYIGLQLKPVRHVRISSYYDQFKFSESSINPFPSVGNDYLAQIELLPFSRFEVRFRYQRKINESRQSVIDENGFSTILHDKLHKQNFRLNLEYRISRDVKLRSRFDRVFLEYDALGKIEKGMAMYQDLVWNLSQTFWLNFRLAYFRTDSYDAGIYEYERDVEGVLTQPVLYGSGTRWYVLVKYQPIENLEISAKYSDHLRDDVKKIGTGLDELPGNHDNRVSVQLDFEL